MPRITANEDSTNVSSHNLSMAAVGLAIIRITKHRLGDVTCGIYGIVKASWDIGFVRFVGSSGVCSSVHTS